MPFGLNIIIMRDFEFFLEKLSQLGRAEITCYAYGQFWDLHTSMHANPLRENAALRGSLIRMTLANPHIPALIRDEHNVLYAAIAWEDAPVTDVPDSSGEQITPVILDGKELPLYWNWFLIGPMALQVMTPIEQRRYYRHYMISKAQQEHPPVLSYNRAIAMVQIAAMILGKRTNEREIIRVNGLDMGAAGDLDPEQLRFSWAQEEEESAHHTYTEESALLDHVRSGNAEEAVHMSHHLDQQMGTMSKDSLSQWKKTLTAAVTLITRAAIEGGVSPLDAYSLSDYYLQKCDSLKEVPAIIALRDSAVRDFCARVQESSKKNDLSPTVRRACDYIRQHYREKLYLKDIADRLGISESHLSRIFHQETGISVQEFIVRVRVERAANMLRYSKEPLSAISDYVGFPSQSYFGAVFRRYMGVTPRAFRAAEGRE